MKQISISFLLFMLCIPLFAQDSIPEKKFLFKNEKLQLSTFFAEIAPGTSWSTINGKSSNVSSLSLGFILNRKFSLAVYNYNSPKVNLVEVPPVGSETYNKWLAAGVDLSKLSFDAQYAYVTFSYWGLRLGYQYKSHNTVFPRAGFEWGLSGGLKLSESKNFLGLFNNVIYETKVGTMTPRLGLGVNLLKWWRMYIDLGYRFVYDSTSVDKDVLAQEFDSMTFSIGFGFGNFLK